MILGPEALRVGLQIGSKLLLARFRDGHIFGEKFHFLPPAARNNDVGAVQAGRPALAVEHLVANVVIDEALQFLFARLALPRTGETIRKVGDPKRRNDDLRGSLIGLLADKIIKAEQGPAEHEELQ